MTDIVFTRPKLLEMLTPEVLPLEIDVGLLVDQDETPSLPVVTVTNTRTDQPQTAGVGVPSFDATICTVPVGPLPSGSYRLLLSFTTAPGKIRACATDLTVQF